MWSTYFGSTSLSTTEDGERVRGGLRLFVHVLTLFQFTNTNTSVTFHLFLLQHKPNTHLLIDAMESYVCESYKSSNLSLGF